MEKGKLTGIIPGKLFGSDTLVIINNFFFLSVIQLTNFLLPLIILPFLIRVIGMERVGDIAMAQALMSYLIIITDYGFNLTATREISVNRHDILKQSKIVSCTLTLKAILTVVTFLILAITIQVIPKFELNSSLYYWAFLLVIGQVLLPTWFFQGLEKMKYLAYVNLAGKVLFVAFIFFYIKAPKDYIYVIVFLSLGNIVAGLVGLWIMFRRFGISFMFPTLPELREELHQGWYVMVSNFSINGYINSNIIILGLYTNPILAGYYSVADKMLYALRQVLTLFFQATYPQACKQIARGHDQIVSFFKKYFLPFFVGMSLLCIVICIAAPWITYFFVKKENDLVTHAIRVLSLVPIVVCGNIPAYQTLLAYNFQSSIMKILVTGSLLNILLNLILAKYFLTNGTLASVVLTELFITIGLHLILIYKHSRYRLFM